MSMARARACIEAGDWQGLYRTRTWKRLKAEVLAYDKGECQFCKAKGWYSPATDAHHINRVRARPDLALEAWYVCADGERRRNIVSLCHKCHRKEHWQGALRRALGEAGMARRAKFPEKW